MRKGISPIVAVVLLIAIAVIAAVGLYFWVTAYTGQQTTPGTPCVLTATCVGAGETTNGTISVSNTGTKTCYAVTATAGGSSSAGTSLNAGNTTTVSASSVGATLYSGTDGIVTASNGGTVDFHCTEAA